MEPSHFSGGHQKNGARLLIVSTLNRHEIISIVRVGLGVQTHPQIRASNLSCAPQRKISANDWIPSVQEFGPARMPS